jgi:hypothetical protein
VLFRQLTPPSKAVDQSHLPAPQRGQMSHRLSGSIGSDRAGDRVTPTQGLQALVAGRSINFPVQGYQPQVVQVAIAFPILKGLNQLVTSS